MRLVTLIILSLIATTTYAKEPTLKEKADYNKSITALMGGVSQLTTAQSTALKNYAEYLHKLTTIQELQEKIKAARLDNEMKYAEQFYAKRELYEKNKKKRTVTQKNIESLADKRVKLTSFQASQNDSWPTIFNTDVFKTHRIKLKQLFEEQTSEDSGIGSQNYNQINLEISRMKTTLKDYIKTMTPAEYLVAKRFLDKLAYQASFRRAKLDDLIASYF